MKSNLNLKEGNDEAFDIAERDWSIWQIRLKVKYVKTCIIPLKNPAFWLLYKKQRP